MQLQADDSGTPRPQAQPATERAACPSTSCSRRSATAANRWPGVPYEERKGIVPNVDGRVVEQLGGDVRVGHYCRGLVQARARPA